MHENPRRSDGPAAGARLLGAMLISVLLLGAAACQENRRAPTGTPSQRGPLLSALLTLAAEAESAALVSRRPLGSKDSHAILERMAQSIRAASRDHGRRHPAELLNQVVFDRFGFARTIDDRSARRTLLPQVLAARRGNCLGLGGLYLALGERLGLPLHGVLVPGHFFVSYRPTVGDRYEARDIELLKRGRQMPRSWYRRKYPMPPGSSLYLRPLSWRESLAVFWYNLANDLRQARRYREAIRLYEKVVARLPGFAAAQANLGLSYHRLRQWEKAERAYLRARTINASLPGLQRNLQALHRHRLQRPSAQP